MGCVLKPQGEPGCLVHSVKSDSLALPAMWRAILKRQSRQKGKFPMETQESKRYVHDLKATANFVVSICHALAVTLEVFIHAGNTFGERYIGLNGAIGIFLILVFSMFFPSTTLFPLVIFLLAVVTRCVHIRLGI